MHMSTVARLNMQHTEKKMMKYYDDGGPGAATALGKSAPKRTTAHAPPLSLPEWSLTPTSK